MLRYQAVTSSPVYFDVQERQREPAAGGDVLPYYRYIDSRDYNRGM